MITFRVGDLIYIPEQLINGVTKGNFRGGWNTRMTSDLGKLGKITEVLEDRLRIAIPAVSRHWVWDIRLFTSPLSEEERKAVKQAETVSRVIAKIKFLDKEWKKKQDAKKNYREC